MTTIRSLYDTSNEKRDEGFKRSDELDKTQCSVVEHITNQCNTDFSQRNRNSIDCSRLQRNECNKMKTSFAPIASPENVINRLSPTTVFNSSSSSSLPYHLHTDTEEKTESMNEGKLPLPDPQNRHYSTMQVQPSKRHHRDDDEHLSNLGPAATGSENHETEIFRGIHPNQSITLPTFRDHPTSMWISSYEANSPSEDRNSSLVNILLRPTSNKSNSKVGVVRMSLWCVLDGHGGGAVASYASEVLLPHIAANISRVLRCAIVSRGTFTVNGKARDAEALDFDGLLKSTSISSSDTSVSTEGRRYPKRKHRVIEDEDDSEDEVSSNIITNLAAFNPHSIDYSSPEANETEERDEECEVQSEEAGNDVHEEGDHSKEEDRNYGIGTPPIVPELDSDCEIKTETPECQTDILETDEMTSTATMGKPNISASEVGTHSPAEMEAVEKALKQSFLAIDEGWINSIDSTKRQSSCMAGGRWNAGACALVSCVIQKIEGTFLTNINGDNRVFSEEANQLRSGLVGSSHMSSLSPVQSLQSKNMESENVDKDDLEVPHDTKSRKVAQEYSEGIEHGNISTNYPAMLYTAHCGDCRAVLGSTLAKSCVGYDRYFSKYTQEDVDSDDDSDDDVLCSSDNSDSSSDDDSSDEDDFDNGTPYSGSHYMSYLRRPTKRQCNRGLLRISGSANVRISSPFQSLSSICQDFRIIESDYSTDSTTSSISNRNHDKHLIPLPPNMCTIDLTVDHSAYNSAEVELVLQRCNNAPRAISSASSGGIKRVAGSLAVTRALGDAYLKTPELSFFPYKKHTPYITALPEVSRRILTRDETGQLADRILVMASDGIWERANGKSVMKWVQTFYKEKSSRHQRLSNDSYQLSSPRNLWQSDERNHTTSDSVSDVIVRQVLRKICRSRKISSLHALMNLPKGKARRSKHDDITVCVIDLVGFVS